MISKPEIQYVGQFYVHGSEARKIEVKKEQKTAKTCLPLERLQKIEKIYVDPVALVAIAVSVVMLVTMILGVLQISRDVQEYQAASSMVSQLKELNGKLNRKYRTSFKPEEIRVRAEALGMIPAEEAPVMTVSITMPEPEPEVSWMEEKTEYIRWFWNGLWA